MPSNAYQQPYDIAVYGNEPAGLWLLNRLARNGKRCLWIRLTDPLEDVYLPTPLFEPFDINFDQPTTFDFYFKNKKLSWNPQEIKSLFPESSFFFESACLPNAPELTKLIKVQPEILNFANALWFAFAHSLKAEQTTQVYYALMYASTSIWQTSSYVLDKSVDVFFLDQNKASLLEPKKPSLYELTLSNGQKFSSSFFIINLKMEQLDHLESAELLSPLISSLKDDKTRSSFSSASTLKTAIGIKPISFSLNAYPFTNPEKDILMIERKGPAESVHVKSLNPDFSEAVETLKVFEEYKTLENLKEEVKITGLKTQKTLLHSTTPFPRISNLFSHLNSHYPYPYGTLLEAKRLEAYLIKKTKKNTQDKLPISILSG